MHAYITHVPNKCVCVYILCACAFLFPLVDGWKSIWGVTSNWNAAYLTMTFPFNFIAHRYFDAHLIVGTDNLRGKEQSIWSIYVNGVVRCGACGSVCYLALLALLVMFYALHNLIVLWFCVAIQIAAWVWVWYVNLSVDWLLLQFKLIFCVRRPMSVKLLFWSYTVFGGGHEKQMKKK